MDILLDISCDPDLNFYKINIKNIITPYIIPENFHILLDDSASESFSVLHLNIRSMNKKLWKLLKFLGRRLKNNFSIVFFSETWLNDLDSCNQDYELPNYKSIHHIKKRSRRGEASIYILKNFSFKIRHDLSINARI